MADENKICTCTTPEYTINLEKQGPPGVKGETGENGFSPVIDVIQNTPSEYILNITTANGLITTPNLKGNLPTGGSTGMVLTKNSDVSGDASFAPLPSASTENPGIVQLATVDDFTPDEEGNVNNLNAVTPDIFNSELKAQVGEYIVAGDNITTSVGEDGKVTINAEAEAYSLPQANATTLGGIKANPKTDEDTQAVNIDPATGLLYTKAGGEGSANTVFNSVSPILINQNCNPYINNNGFYILENSYNNNGSNNITINDHVAISGLPTSGTITLNIQNVTGNKTDWDNNVLGFDITDPNNAKIYAGDATQGFAKFIVLCNKSGNNVTPLYIAVGDDSRLGPYNVGDANACLLNNIEFQNIQDNKGIYNANIKQIINDTPYNMQNFFVIILVDLNIIQLMCVGTDGEERLLYNVSGLTDLANINYAYVLSGSITTKFNKDTVYSIVDEQKIYPTIIRNATDVNISLKYSNKFVLNNGALDLANTITTQGNTFNGASQLVQLDSTGKLPAIDGSQLTNLPASPAPANMVTTDTSQTITAIKTFNSAAIFNYSNKPSIAIGNIPTSISMSYEGAISDDSAHILRDTSTDWRVGRYNKQGIISSSTPLQRMGAAPYFNKYPILDSSNLGSYVDGTTITYTDGKLKASGSSAPTNMVTTDTAQTITGTKTFDGDIAFLNNVGLTSQASTFAINLGDVSSPAQYCNITIRDGGLKIIDYDNTGNKLNFLTRGTYWRVSGDLRRYINGTDHSYITTADIGNLKYWTGTEANYTAIETKNADTLYRTTDTNKVYLGDIQLSN